jgi:ribonuclease P protein component
MNHTFPKKERLKSLKKIQTVISKGKVIRFGYVRTHWMIIPSEMNENDPAPPMLKAGFSVPKKKIKRACERNQIRRKMKEIFRLNKAPIYEHIPEEKQLLIFFIYQNDQNTDYKTIEGNLIKALNRIQESIKRNEKSNP